MADLKPIGSEKLSGQDKIKRIMEIARYKENSPSNLNETSRSEFNIGLADGNEYQIVKEKQGYIIKKTISEGTTDYIEPMKNRKYFSSYSQALKRLNLLTKEINRINENEEEISLFGEQRKVVLRTPKAMGSVEDEPVAAPPAPPAEPPAVPEPELPPSPDASAAPTEDGMDIPSPEGMGDEMGDENAPEGEEVSMDAEVEVGGEEKVTFKTIQKLTGKLTQKIRTLDSEEGMTSEDIKYVINMVLSSLDLKNLSEEDKEDIMSKFEEETEDLGGDDMDGTDLTDDSEVEDIQADMDVDVEQGGDMQSEPEMAESGHGAIIDSIFRESKVDKVISKYFEMSKKEIMEQRKLKIEKEKEKLKFVERKMKAVSNLSETAEQELASKKFLEENATSEFIGKTNKKNLVFENSKGKRVKISPEGLLV
jgi:hypothetical protein